MNILCGCGYKKELYTSKTVEKAGVNICNKGMKPFEVNFRAVYGMPKPMTVNNFNNISNGLRVAAKVVAEKNMNAAANDLKNSDSDILDIGVFSVDGSWQRRGFSSLNGVVAALSTARYCRQFFVNTRR